MRKTLKKSLTLFIALAMCFSLLGGATLASAAQGYQDYFDALPYELVLTEVSESNLKVEVAAIRDFNYGAMQANLVWDKDYCSISSITTELTLGSFVVGLQSGNFNVTAGNTYEEPYEDFVANGTKIAIYNITLNEDIPEGTTLNFGLRNIVISNGNFEEIHPTTTVDATGEEGVSYVVGGASTETYVNINGTDVSYTEIEARMENIEETTKSFNSNEVTAKFLSVSALASAECAYTLAASDTSTTIAADEAYVYFDNGVLRSAKDGGTGKNWISGIESITSVNEHTYVDGVCTVCGEADPDYVAAAYTVSLVPSATEVAPGETVDVDVVVETENEFTAWDITVEYETELFTFTEDSTASGVKGTSDGTGIQLLATNDANVTTTDGKATIATLSFTAAEPEATATGDFTVTEAKIAKTGDAQQTSGDYIIAAKKDTSVTIVVPETTTYTVTFEDADGTELGTVTVDENGKVAIADVPTATPADHYEFAGWNDGTGTAYTNDEIAELSVTADVTYTATYAAEKYDVTFDADEIEAPTKATYGENYNGEVADYDPNYEYTVIATFEGGVEKEYDVDTDGSFTIPARDIVGDMTLTVSKTLSGVTAAVYEYIGGETNPYSLVVVYGGAAGYTYNGQAMYRTAYYDGDGANTVNGYAYAYMIKGTTTSTAVLNALTPTTTAAEEITASYDVNFSGDTAIGDAQAVRDCYNGVNADNADLMGVFLRADVNASHKVDSTDISAVLNSLWK